MPYYGESFKISNLVRHKDKIVYLNSMVDISYFSSQDFFFGSLKTPTGFRPTVYKNSCEGKESLRFCDKIESGNLYFALEHDPNTYILSTRFDYNTRSYGQWFYFRVTNCGDKSNEFRFLIVNMTKNATMFGKGLKISVCRNGVWGKEGASINYYQNKFSRAGKGRKYFDDFYYTLAFTIPIDSNESVYIAYNEPYTYTKLGQRIDSMLERCPFVHRSLLCRTPLGNRIDVISISAKNNQSRKKVIFITARAHPVETAGSFVIEGILDALTSLEGF